MTYKCIITRYTTEVLFLKFRKRLTLTNSIEFTKSFVEKQVEIIFEIQNDRFRIFF